MVQKYMAAHGNLNDDHPLVFVEAAEGVLHVQSHDLGVSFSEPLLVHVEYPLQFARLDGVDHRDLLVAMDVEVELLGEEVLGGHGEGAGKKKLRLQLRLEAEKMRSGKRGKIEDFLNIGR